MGRYGKRGTKLSASFAKLEQTSDFVSELKNLFNRGQVKKMFKIGSTIFESFQPFIEKPTFWNAGRAAVSVGKVIIDDVEVWSESYFDGDEWIQPFTRDFNGTILEVLGKFPYTTLKTSDDSTVIRMTDLNGCKAGWTYNVKLESVDHIYVETEKAQHARDLIKRTLWEQYKGQSLVMRYNRRLVMTRDEPKVVFEIDDAFHPQPSEKATEYSKYLRRCLDAGVTRSVMLYGPPGTGKSTMARTLVENLNLRSFRIRVEDVGNLENGTLFEAISIFEPDAIILDDFDRADRQIQLLETLEFFQRHVKLVVATVNDKSNLDDALLRPGRFDELVLIDKMDEGVVKHMLGDYLDGFDDVKDWPIAFIQEYVKRRRFMSAEEAAASTVDLSQRVRKLDKYRDVGEHETLFQNVKSKHKRGKASYLKASALKELLVEMAAAEDDESEEPVPDTQRNVKPGPSVSIDDLMDDD